MHASPPFMFANRTTARQARLWLLAHPSEKALSGRPFLNLVDDLRLLPLDSSFVSPPYPFSSEKLALVVRWTR
eukprot:6212856-Pleurochrysis_carterae.AAC.2